MKAGATYLETHLRILAVARAGFSNLPDIGSERLKETLTSLKSLYMALESLSSECSKELPG